MKQAWKIALAAPIMLAAPQPMLAESLSAERLRQLSISKAEAEKAACQFFIYGVFDGLLFGDSTMRGADRKMADRPKAHFCPPDSVTVDQMVTAFENPAAILLQKYPEDMKEGALGILDAAFDTRIPASDNAAGAPQQRQCAAAAPPCTGRSISVSGTIRAEKIAKAKKTSI